MILKKKFALFAMFGLLSVMNCSKTKNPSSENNASKAETENQVQAQVQTETQTENMETSEMQKGLNGDWVLAKLNGGPINRMVALPTLNIDLTNKLMSGNAGCNLYKTTILSLTDSKIEISPIGTTKKLCNNKNIEAEFISAFDTVKSYKIDDQFIIFYDQTGKEVVSFITK